MSGQGKRGASAPLANSSDEDEPHSDHESGPPPGAHMASSGPISGPMSGCGVKSKLRDTENSFVTSMSSAAADLLSDEGGNRPVLAPSPCSSTDLTIVSPCTSADFEQPQNQVQQSCTVICTSPHGLVQNVQTVTSPRDGRTPNTNTVTIIKTNLTPNSNSVPNTVNNDDTNSLTIASNVLPNSNCTNSSNTSTPIVVTLEKLQEHQEKQQQSKEHHETPQQHHEHDYALADHDYENVSSPGSSSTASEPSYVRQPGFTHHAHEVLVTRPKIKKKKTQVPNDTLYSLKEPTPPKAKIKRGE